MSFQKQKLRAVDVVVRLFKIKTRVIKKEKSIFLYIA